MEAFSRFLLNTGLTRCIGKRLLGRTASPIVQARRTVVFTTAWSPASAGGTARLETTQSATYGCSSFVEHTLLFGSNFSRARTTAPCRIRTTFVCHPERLHPSVIFTPTSTRYALYLAKSAQLTDTRSPYSTPQGHGPSDDTVSVTEPTRILPASHHPPTLAAPRRVPDYSETLREAARASNN